jgi:DNA-binding transcriptional ArsR family regulator
MPIFRSQLQGELLARLLLGPERELTMTDLARQLGADLATVSREVNRLSKAGILSLRRIGPSRLVSRNTETRVYEPLARLLMVTFGPEMVIAEEFARVTGAHAVYIFGSWAARHEGVQGPEPNDVDVLVVGDVDRDDLFDAAERAEARLGLSVNPVARSVSDWSNLTDPFLQQLQGSPLVGVFQESGTKGDGDRAVVDW